MNRPLKPLTAAQAEKLTAAAEPWLSCDDCFDQVDEYVDALVRGDRGLNEPLRVHLANCVACYEEAETLVCLAAEDQGVSQGRVMEAFRVEVNPSADTTVQSRSLTTRLFRRRRTVS